MAPGSPRRRGAWRPTWTGLSRGRSPPTCLSGSSCAPSSSSTSRRRRRLASRSRQRCSSGQTGSCNEGLSYQLDNRRDRAAEPPPAADALQPPLRCGFRARLRRSVTQQKAIREQSDMLARMDLDTQRQFYAEEIRAVANLQSEVLVQAFAKVPREYFLGPGP